MIEKIINFLYSPAPDWAGFASVTVAILVVLATVQPSIKKD